MSSRISPTIWSHHRIEWGQQTYVMGIVNVTPDSFSGDGLKREVATEENLIQRAIEQAQHFVAEGATFIDVGGEPNTANCRNHGFRGGRAGTHSSRYSSTAHNSAKGSDHLD